MADLNDLMNKVRCIDVLEGLRQLPDESIDEIVSDPPYGLEFMGRDWDKAVPPVEVWKECLRVLKRTGGYNELKEKIKSLMHRNPQIRVRDIVAETGYSEYMVLRAYLTARRELFARPSK